MWFIFALLTFLAWGTADLFYKLGSDPEDRYSHLKIVCCVGLVMGVHAVIHMLINDLPFVPMDLVKYLPVSAMYIISMTVGYVGLRYIELSISSPIQNSSGAVTAVLLLIFFGFDQISGLEYAGVIMMCLGVFWLSYIEKKNADAQRTMGDEADERYRKGFMAIFFPILYCIIDGLGGFADGIYLDQLELMTEDAALVAYELTFLICAICAFIYLRVIKKENFNILKEKHGLAAALFETIGQYFFVFAIAGNSVVAAPIIASYCVLSVIWSRVFLKEKLSGKQYAAIIVVFAGILLCGLAEGLAG